jgi:hypothetical protein
MLGISKYFARPLPAWGNRSTSKFGFNLFNLGRFKDAVGSSDDLD